MSQKFLTSLFILGLLISLVPAQALWLKGSPQDNIREQQQQSTQLNLNSDQGQAQIGNALNGINVQWWNGTTSTGGSEQSTGGSIGDVNGTGGILNQTYNPTSTVQISTYSYGGSSGLQSYDINTLVPLNAGGLTAGSGYQPQRTLADVAVFQISNSYIVLDSMSYSCPGTPEPASLVLLLFSIVGWFFVQRKIRQA